MRPRTPGTVVAARVVVGAQVALALAGLAGAVVVGLVAAFGFAFQIDMGTDGTAFVIGLAAAIAALLTVVAGLLAAATRLTRGREAGRIALAVWQSLLLVGALLLATVVGDALDLTGVATPVAIALAVSALAALGVLFARPTRRWCHAC